MASVHIARLLDPQGGNRTVAVKRTHPHLARDPDFALMFLDEARVASRIRHPNVVATIDILEETDELALVMEYVHGESLWKLGRVARERGLRTPVPVAVSILVGTLHGLHAAHEATDEGGTPLQIVHRDVSPQNILVGTDGVARLVDFGIAKAVGRLHSTRDSSVKGKYAYMAPEQVRGDKVTRLTDTYAAAIVLWELLTGERLFAGKTEAETIHKCLVGRVQAPSLFAPDLAPVLDEIVKKALSREPAHRYSTALALAEDLAAVVPAIDAAEVGAWVSSLASDTLDARARELAEIAEAETGDAPTVVMASPASPAPLPFPAHVAQGVTVAGESAAGPRLHRRIMTSALVALALVAAGAVVLGARRRPVAAVPGSPVVTQPATSPAPPAPPEPAASPGMAVGPAPTTIASSPQVATAVPATARPAPRSPSHPSRPKRAPCDPPYSVDSQGRQIFKPECM